MQYHFGSQTLSVAVMVACLTIGCDHQVDLTEPPENEEEPIEISHDGTALAIVDGVPREFIVWAERSGYDANQVVLRAKPIDIPLVLMLTFDLELGKSAVNTAMTGFWDLGFCRPTKKHVVTGDGYAKVTVSYYNPTTRVLNGTFAVRAIGVDPPNTVVDFKYGGFSVRLQSDEFVYCMEG